MRKGDVVYYTAGDHLGTTSLVLRQVGSSIVKVAESRHYPYGEIRWTDVPDDFPTDYRFTGQRLDGFSQLTHMGARWYDGALGRWLSADTLVPDPANPQSFNRYSYVLANVLRYIDPTGHFSDDEIKEYLENTYDSYWELYWKAWQADPYFMWVLHEADDGFSLSTLTNDGLGVGRFERVGSTFIFDAPGGSGVVPIPGITLADYQGKGPYALRGPNDEKVKDVWIGERVDDAALHRLFGNQSRQTVYQPVYDYSHGAPIFTGQWRQSYYQAQISKFDLLAGAAIPFIAEAAEKLGKIKVPFGVVVMSAVDQAFRTSDYLVVNMIYEPIRSTTTGPVPYPNFWAKPNPNGPYPTTP